MTALSANRTDSARFDGKFQIADVAADAVIYVGAMVAVNADGYLEPATTADNIIVVGTAKEAVDNTGGADGDRTCRFERGVFDMKNSAASDLIALTNVGSPCYAVDDQTVALTDNSGARSLAGTIQWVTDAGTVMVRID